MITIALICVATGFALGTIWAARAAPDVEDCPPSALLRQLGRVE
jgi:hypothetical protein